jgi:hypothetical protein
MVSFFEEEIERGRDTGDEPERLQYWKWIQRNLVSKPESELSESLQAGWRKQLFFLRWVDEYTR